MMYTLLNYTGYIRGPRGFGGICGMNGGFFGGFHMMFGLIIIGILIYFIYQNAKKNNQQANPQSVQQKNTTAYDEALKHLAMRFANGEIDEETYVKMKQQLRD